LLAASPHVGDFMEQPAVLALMADTLRGAGTPAEWQPCPPPDWATVLPPRYQVREEIGPGGMGLVLRGHDTAMDREVACKVLLAPQPDPIDLRQRFAEEARISGRLQHPGIVPVYDMGRAADQRPYFTMKLVRGRTLATLLRERRQPGEERA